MPIITGSFNVKDAKITVQKPNSFSRLHLWRLLQLLVEHGTGDIRYDDAKTMCFYLANTVNVEGSLGFPVPIHDPTHTELMTFIRGLGESDGKVIQAWDDAINDLVLATNDPDLLPPQELSQKKETIPALNSKD